MIGRFRADEVLDGGYPQVCAFAAEELRMVPSHFHHTRRGYIGAYQQAVDRYVELGGKLNIPFQRRNWRAEQELRAPNAAGTLGANSLFTRRGSLWGD